MPEEFTARTRLLLGDEAVARLSHARVAVIGVGGVGSFAVEALIRAGVGNLLLVDNDTVAPSNLNRQLHATTNTIGQHKTLLMAQRAREINPAISVATKEEFVLPENVAAVLAGEFDYIIDAVDTVAAKLALIEEAGRRAIPIISAMGTGNKLDAGRFRIGDITETSMCPLCRVMRRELRARGIPRLTVVWSDEEPAIHHRPPGSVSFVPPVAGMLLAGFVVREIIKR
jgi:tRNA A37 threonylcarbamoyladenosine dehydratase